jgi:hypothetical protein
MESCLGTIKTELVHEARYSTRDAARRNLFAYIEGYYNRQRLHSTGYITPEQAECRAACPVSTISEVGHHCQIEVYRVAWDWQLELY